MKQISLIDKLLYEALDELSKLYNFEKDKFYTFNFQFRKNESTIDLINPIITLSQKKITSIKRKNNDQ